MTASNTRLGIWLMIAATFVFATQDVLSRHLATEYDVRMIVMIRFWFFAAFVIAIAKRQSGSIRAAAKTSQPWLQAFRGVLLVLEICVMVTAFVRLGLIESHAIFACYPLLIAALAGPILGEKVGWRRWGAIGIGFLGILIILQPGLKVFSTDAFWALGSAIMFAIYGLLTRFAAHKDNSATSFFWTGTSGAVTITAIGIWYWEPMILNDWIWMILLCIISCIAHFMLIKVYEIAEISAVQPFAYMQLVFSSAMGMFFFGDILRTNVAIGTVIIISAGLFTLFRERQSKQTINLADSQSPK